MPRSTANAVRCRHSATGRAVFIDQADVELAAERVWASKWVQQPAYRKQLTKPPPDTLWGLLLQRLQRPQAL